jgi:hypothetical protein
MNFSPEDLPPELLILAGGIIGLLCLFFGLRAKRMQRLMSDLPTSKTTGVFMGFNELKGSAESDQPLTSYLARLPCIYYRWSVQEKWSRTVTETYTDSNGDRKTRTRHESGWTTVDSGGEMRSFFLHDDYGSIRVQPEGANIEPKHVFSDYCYPNDPLYYGKGPRRSVMDSDHYRHFSESAIPIDAQLYVLGQARERNDLVAAEIAAAEEAPVYLISTRSEEQISSGKVMKFGFLSLLGAIALVGSVVYFDHVQHSAEPRIPLYMGIGVGYLAIWMISWFWMVANSIIELRNRVRQAESLIDVQLTRRADLIPHLVQCAKAISAHEQGIQERLAHLRTDYTPKVTPLLYALSEAYPDLKANTEYMGLQRNLIDTENRIALARNYYNQIATFYNDRQEIIPDRWVASMTGKKTFSLLTVTEPERDAPQVDLTT